MRELRRKCHVWWLRFHKEKTPLWIIGMIGIHIGFVGSYLTIAILNQ